MDSQFWLGKWRRNEIGFHLDQPNPYLQRYWRDMRVPAGGTVLVPLCGKSVDMAWLAEQGFAVVGIELSRIAVEAFFQEQGLVPDQEAAGPFRRYRAGRIEIFCGDIFQLPALALDHIVGVYDRAALIALPPPQRQRYAAMLCEHLPPSLRMLLIALEYPQAEHAGPPFSVPEREIRRLYSNSFRITLVQRVDLLASSDSVGLQGVTSLHECVWRLSRGA